MVCGKNEEKVEKILKKGLTYVESMCYSKAKQEERNLWSGKSTKPRKEEAKPILRRWGDMSTYEAISLMIAFGSLIVLILGQKNDR